MSLLLTTIFGRSPACRGAGGSAQCPGQCLRPQTQGLLQGVGLLRKRGASPARTPGIQFTTMFREDCQPRVARAKRSQPGSPPGLSGASFTRYCLDRLECGSSSSLVHCFTTWSDCCTQVVGHTARRAGLDAADKRARQGGISRSGLYDRLHLPALHAPIAHLHALLPRHWASDSRGCLFADAIHLHMCARA